MSAPITFLSDYGTRDEFAGVCRAVIARIAPEVKVIDLTHGIPAHNVRAGAAVLATALPYAPEGVHLAVIDPGVGSERKGVAVRAASGDHILVGPDNGLLWPALERLGGATEAVEVSRSPVRLEPVSATFHGRDVFSPVAAALARHGDLARVGDRIDPGTLVRIERHPPRIEAGREVVAAVSHVDRFGNAALDLDEAEARQAGLRPGSEIVVDVGGRRHAAIYAVTFADVPAGGLILYLDSRRTLALAVNRDRVADRLGLASGDEVAIRAAP
ncbi:MAG TPA: SAM-dependent chlorinase/fluorinase [Solirubrobacterales bacterium]|nr:SAM-dependent chlorinase/fluorinase [Solirubrobacterales bacterium]